MSTTVMDCEFFYEREAEYFGFTPFQLLDQIGEIVVKTVYGMFDRVATNTLIPHAPFLSHGQVEAGVGQWTALVESRFSRNYELFETYVIKNVLLVPDHFVLPHHRTLAPEGTAPDVLGTRDILQLAQRLQAAKQLDAQLDAQERALREEEAVLEKMEQQLDLLREQLASHKMGAFEQITRSLGDHLGDLQKIVLNTIEQSRNLHAITTPDNDKVEQWGLAQCRGTEDEYGTQDHALLLEREMVQCMQVASLDELATFHAYL